MAATWHTLLEWPHPRTEKPRASQFRTSWSRSLVKLEEEIGRSGGSDVEIGIVATPDQLTYGGFPRANLRVLYRGVEVSFERDGRRLAFRTDAYPVLHDNIHAIALTLEALRAVERYGATSGEQWSGFAQLTAGGPDPERGRLLVGRVGSLAKALRATHPDTREDGFTDRDFADVQAYRQSGPVAR